MAEATFELIDTGEQGDIEEIWATAWKARLTTAAGAKSRSHISQPGKLDLPLY